MLKQTLFAITALTCSALSQSPLSTFNAPNNQGNIGGIVYFDLTVGATNITITDLAWVPAAIGAQGGGMDIYMGPASWQGSQSSAAAWSVVASTAGSVPLTAGTLTAPDPLNNAICLEANTTYGFALVATNGTSGFSHNYQNGTGCPLTGTATGIGNVSTNELQFIGGAAQNAPFNGTGVFCPRVWQGEIHYTVDPTCTPIAVATNEQYGEGCVKDRTSYDEQFLNPSTSLDVAGITVLHQFTGSTYNVSVGGTPFTPPGAGAIALPVTSNTDVQSVAANNTGGQLPFPVFFPNGAGGVGIADDLEVCASGYVTPVDVAGAGTTAPAPGSNPGDLSSTLDEFLQGAARWCPNWVNQDPSTSGSVVFEVLGAGAELVVTWSAVPYGGLATSANTYQIAFFANGDVEFRYDASQTGAGAGGSWPTLIGWTPGPAPGATQALQNSLDVSSINLTTSPIDNQELFIDLDMRPVIGTNPNIVLDGYDPAQAALVFLLFNFTPDVPGTLLSSLGIGAGDCRGYVAINFNALALGTGGVAPVTRSLVGGPIPSGAGLNGLEFYIQGAALQANCANGPCNPLGATFSNGLRIFIGLL